MLVEQDRILDRHGRRREQCNRFENYFVRLRSEGRGIAVWGTAHSGTFLRHPTTGDVSPPVNAHLLHLHIGIDTQVDPKMHIQLASGALREIRAAVLELGVETDGMDTPIAILPETGTHSSTASRKAPSSALRRSQRQAALAQTSA